MEKGTYYCSPPLSKQLYSIFNFFVGLTSSLKHTVNPETFFAIRISKMKQVLLEMEGTISVIIFE